LELNDEEDRAHSSPYLSQLKNAALALKLDAMHSKN
jgi:hypothetical protein